MLTRCAGVLVPLFSLHSKDDLGRGEIGGLAAMGELALAMGHRMVQLLPIDETAPGENSPYSAMSVFAIDPMYVSVGELAGIEAAAITKARAALGLDRNAFTNRTVAHERVYAIKTGLLDAAFRAFQRNQPADEREAFDGFIEASHYWLDEYALFRALKEHFGWSEWVRWPAGLRDREGSALAAARRDLSNEIVKYQYWQFIAQRQWLEVRSRLKSRGVILGGDLAFSPGQDSAEVWANQHMFDLTRAVGAPPDAFSQHGQRWGLPMPDWKQMRADGFALIRARTRRARELYDLMRVDHVVGLYRTYSFGNDAGDGRFYPAEEDAQRAQGEAVIDGVKQVAAPMALIAEDLGLVPPFVRKSLAAMGVPGYKVMRWEKRNWRKPTERFISPAEYPEVSLATTGTHDTETLTQWWREAPVKERRQLMKALRIRGGSDDHDGVPPSLSHALREAILEALYASPSRLVIVPLQDLLGWTARINTPGTVNVANWMWRVPCPLERMTSSASVRARLARIHAITEHTGRYP
ncbi:MAG: 4-alpha-glucanotransferase [Candidatus Binataceae bacterium]